MSRVVDVALERYARVNPARRPALRRTHDLVRLFFDGEGSLSADAAPLASSPITFTGLPWTTAWPASSYLATWGPEEAEEAAIGFVLRTGQSWCTPDLDTQAGTRLRLEAVPVAPLEAGRETRLEATWRPERGSPAPLPVRVPRAPGPLSAEASSDTPVPAGRGTLCFRATGAPVFVGEPRLLAPEPHGFDSRPRWIVLTIVDTLRADALPARRPDTDLPAMSALAARGRHFANALSPGAHTWAAVPPLMTGRDLTRIDPRLARMLRPAVALGPLYVNGNLPVSHVAQEAGYHPVFLGNNSFFVRVAGFARFSNRGRTDTGTVETIRAVPALLERYADERLFLVYFVSAPHSQAGTPRRLLREMGCERAGGDDVARCAYRARVRHADEAIAALQTALADHGLESVFQVLTADHGEMLGDGWKIVIWRPGSWYMPQHGHGTGGHPAELNVPLIVTGPSIAPGVSSVPVSTLDVVPTLLEAMRAHAPGWLDGRPLELGPSSAARPAGARVFDTYGYCSHTVTEGRQRFVWWEPECRYRRDLASSTPAWHHAELFVDGRRTATDLDAPDGLAHWTRPMAERLRDRLPAESLMLHPRALEGRRVQVTALEGTIVDFGPSASVTALAELRPQLSDDRRRLTIDFGAYRGRFRVATRPPLAPVRIDFEGTGDAPLVHVGALQLPLAAAGRRLDPAADPSFWLASVPRTRPGRGPGLDVWWQTPAGRETAGALPMSDHLDRVLRDWGYIR